jgi:hypothetical protein
MASRRPETARRLRENPEIGMYSLSREGGSAKCDLKNVDTKSARLAAKKIDKKMLEDDKTKTQAVKEELEEM